jgi:rubredoxin
MQKEIIPEKYRPICSVEGCNRKGRNKGMQLGKRRYGHICETHHKQARENRVTGSVGIFTDKSSIPNLRCQMCGWDKAPCDRHRINPHKGYSLDNVKVLCPNCHRLEHFKRTV